MISVYLLLDISLIFSNLEVSNNKYCIMITESKVTEIFVLQMISARNLMVRWQKCTSVHS